MTVRPATPADAAAIARVHVDSWRTTYRGIIADQILEALSYELRERHWHSALTEHRHRNLLHVAEGAPGKVVGFIAAGREREGRPDYPAEIYAIYVLQAFQGRGHGRRLMRQAAADLQRLGMGSVMLWVLRENPSREFYERLGGTLLGEKQITIDGQDLTEVAYGWPDLQRLLAPPPAAPRG